MAKDADEHDEGQDGQNLQSKAAQATNWSVLGLVIGNLLRLASNLILTRLLFEEVFGLLALVNTVLQGLKLFSDLGLAPSVVQSKRGDERSLLDTAWTLAAARGATLAVLMIAISGVVADFYEQPQLKNLLIAVSLTALLEGLASSKLYTASRHMKLKRLTLLELTIQVLSLVITVTWAYFHRSPWALVGGGISAAIVRTTLSTQILPGPLNRFHFNRDDARELLRFGRWVFVSTVLTFITVQASPLIFGQMIPIDLLGVYAVALNVSRMPSTPIGHLAGHVAFPTFSRVVNQGRSLAGIFEIPRWSLLILAGWILSGFIGGGSVAIRFFYDPRYAEAGWILQLLSLAAWLSVLDQINGSAILAMGRPKWTAIGGAAKLLGMVVFIPLGYQYFEFPGALAGYVASDIFRYISSTVATSLAGLRGFRQDIQLSAMVFAASAAGWLCSQWTSSHNTPVIVDVVVVFVSVTLVWAPLLFPPTETTSTRTRRGFFPRH